MHRLDSPALKKRDFRPPHGYVESDVFACCLPELLGLEFAIMNTVDVMGTELLVTSYADLGDKCCQWARGPRSVTVEFSNTQNVVMRRHEPAYKELTDRIDYFVPDGMPVIWCMNR